MVLMQAIYSHGGSIAEDLLEKDFVVISNEMDYAACKPFLERGVVLTTNTICLSCSDFSVTAG